MKFKLILLLLLVISCANTNTAKKIDPYSSSGFALIYNEDDFIKKIISGKLDNSKLEIGHNIINKNARIKIINPKNKKSLELKVAKKVKYPDFYKIIITEKVRQELDLDPNIPIVDIQERIKNKSFIAKKAVTHSEEKRVSNKAPITQVKIDNISTSNEIKSTNINKFTIIIAQFYSKASAESLKETLQKNYVKEGSLTIKKLGKNKYELSSGPYSSINALKNAHFELNKYGFDNLDIKQND